MNLKYGTEMKEKYSSRRYSNLKRMISYYCQVELVEDLKPSNILEIGVGSGFLSTYLRNRSYDVTTLDIDKDLHPDVVGDVRRLPFEDGKFDLVTAFQVLEHIPYSDFERALGEMQRVSKRYVIISLPYRASIFECVVSLPGMRRFLGRSSLNCMFRIPKRFDKSREHQWEIDSGRYKLERVRQDISQHFEIEKELSPAFNRFHYFFVCRKPNV